MARRSRHEQLLRLSLCGSNVTGRRRSRSQTIDFVAMIAPAKSNHQYRSRSVAPSERDPLPYDAEQCVVADRYHQPAREADVRAAAER
jgi:hypothetical protein